MNLLSMARVNGANLPLARLATLITSALLDSRDLDSPLLVIQLACLIEIRILLIDGPHNCQRFCHQIVFVVGNCRLNARGSGDTENNPV